ncbi:hypothetical protein CR513_23316, partial [Mucuna pruriens]
MITLNLYTYHIGYSPFCPILAYSKFKKEDLAILFAPLSPFENLGCCPIFNHTQWKTIGDYLCNMTRNVFEYHHIIISLIPIVERVTNIKEFHLISFIIAQRLRYVMNKLISPCQCDFSLRCYSKDNIIIVQKAINSTRFKKGPKGWMDIK